MEVFHIGLGAGLFVFLFFAGLALFVTACAKYNKTIDEKETK